jgi:predicted dehydrogenase
VTARTRRRLAVVGTRGQGERVTVQTILASETAGLVGVLGSEPQRTRAVADRLGVRAYPSLEALAAGSEVDGVWLTALNHLHAAMATELLEGGLGVLLEKPMAVDVGDAAALARVAAASPRDVACA